MFGHGVSSCHSCSLLLSIAAVERIQYRCFGRPILSISNEKRNMKQSNNLKYIRGPFIKDIRCAEKGVSKSGHFRILVCAKSRT